MRKSFLKWAGGKSQSLSLIQNAIGFAPERLVEPFAGSAVVSLNIEASNYLICDSNDDLIEVFKYLKTRGRYFIDRCKYLFEDGYSSDIYYYNRKRFNNLPSCMEKSALFVYLNRHAFNGLCRYNASGLFNVPIGKYTSIYFPEKEMEIFYNKSQNFEIRRQTFEETFSMQKKGDVFYCDPPYIPINDTSYFTDYTGKGFNMEDQTKLVECAEKSSVPVLISNHWVSGVTEDLYKNARKKFKDIGRSISAKGSSRGKVKEVLAIYNMD